MKKKIYHSERVQGYILRHSALKIPKDLEKNPTKAKKLILHPFFKKWTAKLNISGTVGHMKMTKPYFDRKAYFSTALTPY